MVSGVTAGRGTGAASGVGAARRGGADTRHIFPDDQLVLERVQDPPSRVGAVVHQELRPVVVEWGQGDRRQMIRVTELARLLNLDLYNAGEVRDKLKVMEAYLRMARQFVEGGEEEAAWMNMSSAVSVAADSTVELGGGDLEIVSIPPAQPYISVLRSNTAYIDVKASK